MQNCGFGWQNNVLRATLAASAQASGLPVTNLQNQQGAASLGWRAPGTSAVLTLSGISGAKWQAISLHRTNLSATATWRIRTGSYDTGWWGVDWHTDWSGPCNVANGQCVYVLPSIATDERCEITITDTANPDGFLSVPLLYAGPLFQPVRNFSTQSTSGNNLGQDTVTTLGGSEFVSGRWYQRKLTIVHDSLGDADAAVLDQVLQAAATGQNILFVPDPDATTDVLAQKSLFGTLSGGDLSNPYGPADRHSLTLNLTERL